MRGSAGKRAKRFTLTEQIPAEDSLHKTAANLLHIALLPPAVWTTFPSGMYALPKAAGGRLRAYGLKPGMPDIMVLHRGRTVWLELKRRNGVISKDQKAMHACLDQAGAAVYVCRSPEAVIDALLRERFPVRLSIHRQLLTGGLYQPAEKQTTGESCYGNAGTTSGGAAESEAGAAAP